MIFQSAGYILTLHPVTARNIYRETINYSEMKRCLLTVAVIGLVSVVSFAQEKAVIKIDTDRTISSIDPLVYGNFSEHLGQGIYGGIYDPQSSQSDEDGFRKDVIDQTKELGVSILRWPGGNFVSGYHWEDGIGDKASRPVRIDLAWGGRESNQVGTDEFMKFVRKAGVEPYFCVNLGTGTMDEARNWVEYCNVEEGTYYSDLRRANGQEEPYDVKYWGLGNEVDGPWQMGHKTPEEYAKVATETAKLMRWIDKDIKLVASGSSNYDADWNLWNRTVLNEMYDYIDFISLHHYSHNTSDYYTYLTNTIEVEKYIRIVEQQIQEAKMKHRSSKDVYIAFDEWNAWTRTFGGADNTLSEIYDLQDALIVAQYLNIFMRTSDVVKIANMAQLVNVIAPMRINDDKLWKQTTYYPLYLFSKNCRGTALDVYSESPSYSTERYDEVPYLDVSATYEPERNVVVVNVVNRHKDKAISADVLSQNGNFTGKATVYEVTGSGIGVTNSVSEQNVDMSEKKVKVSSDKMSYEFAPHSFTQIVIGLV